MKIGIFLPDISPDSGGAFTFAETVIAGLVNSGIPDQITVYHYGPSVQLTPKFGNDFARQGSLRSLAGGKKSGFLQRAWYGLFSRFLQRVAERLVHSCGIPVSYSPSSPLDRAARRDGIDLMWFPTTAAEGVECPYVFTVWDLEHWHQPYFPEVAANGEWQSRERYFTRHLRRASYVITGTEVGAKEIRDAYGVHPDRIRRLPHPTPPFALAVSGTLPLPDRLGIRTKYVVYPAQFWAHKNHIVLVEAIAMLRDRGIRVDCAFVGSDKGNRAFLEQRTKDLKVEKNIHYLGFVSREDLIALYQNAVALVYPSLCGPENLPPLEAMALGCPVIASDIAGAKEQFAESALLVDATRSGEIADAIEKLLSDPSLRNALIAKGAIRARTYTDREFTRDLKKIFDEFRNIRRLWL